MNANATLSFDDTVALANKMVGPCSRATLWNMLSTRVRKGVAIDDFTTMALVVAVVGRADAASFVAAVQNVWCKKAAA